MYTMGRNNSLSVLLLLVIAFVVSGDSDIAGAAEHPKRAYCKDGVLEFSLPLFLPLNSGDLDPVLIKGLNLSYNYAINDLRSTVDILGALKQGPSECEGKGLSIIKSIVNTNNSSEMTYLETLNWFQNDSFLGIVGPHSTNDLRTASVAGSALGFPTVSFTAMDMYLEPANHEFQSLFTTCASVQDFARMMAKVCCYFQWENIVLVEDHTKITSSVVDSASDCESLDSLNIRDSVQVENNPEKLANLVMLHESVFLYAGDNHTWVDQLDSGQRDMIFGKNLTWLVTTSFKQFLHTRNISSLASVIVVEEFFEESTIGTSLLEYLKSNDVDTEETHYFLHCYDSVAAYFYALKEVLTKTRIDDLTPSEIIKVLPSLSFPGASGNFTFDGSNSRSGQHVWSKFKLTNYVRTEGFFISSDVAKLEYVHSTNDIEMKPLSRNVSIIWNNGENTSEDTYIEGPFSADKIYLYPSIPKTFFCDDCHHGLCVAEDRCKCDKDWTGAACDEMKYVEWFSGTSMSIMSISFVLGVGLVVTFFVLLANVNHKAMRRSSPPFFFLMFLGIFLLLFVFIFTTGKPQKWQCIGLPWILSISFGLISSNILTKIWRIYKVFHSGTITRNMKLSDSNLFSYAWKFWLFQIAVLVTWTVLSPMKPKLTTEDSDIIYYTCSADGPVSLAFGIGLASIDLVILLTSCYLAFRCRDISNLLSEAKPLSISSYCISFVLLMYVVLSQSVSDGALSGYLILNTCCIVLALSLTFIMILPKVYYIFNCGRHAFFSSSYQSTTEEKDVGNGFPGDEGHHCPSGHRPTNISALYTSNRNFPYSSSANNGCRTPKYATNISPTASNQLGTNNALTPCTEDSEELAIR